MNLKQYMRYRSRSKGSEGGKIIELYKRRLKRLRQVKIKKSALAALAVVVLGIAAVLGIQFHVYHEYVVLSSAENEDTQSSSYVKLGNGLLKYGDDGAYLLSQSQQIIWSQTYEMSNPGTDVRGTRAVIYDKKGTLMYVMTEENPVGPVETKFPILKAEISEKGSVAAILEDGEKTWINYYASDGSLIAENQTRVDNPGYPLDLAVSPNGEIIGVSYLFIDEGRVSSRIVYYNFGDEGQNKVDNIVAEFTYENTVIPQLIYLNDRTSVAFRDDGYSIFEGDGVPKEAVKEETDSEIVSTFYNEKYFGIVVNSQEGENYEMTLYDPSGRKRFSKDFESQYQDISISGDMIIMCDDEQVRMYNLKGILKFDGTIKEGAVKNLYQAASKRYLLVSDSGINTIKIK